MLENLIDDIKYDETENQNLMRTELHKQQIENEFLTETQKNQNQNQNQYQISGKNKTGSNISNNFYDDQGDSINFEKQRFYENVNV